MMRTKVVHSESKDAWNVVGTIPGEKYMVDSLSNIRYVEQSL